MSTASLSSMVSTGLSRYPHLHGQRREDYRRHLHGWIPYIKQRGEDELLQRYRRHG